MRPRTRKRSAAITLVLAGGATLGGCGSPVEQRDAYPTQSACVRDWTDAALCEPVKDGNYASGYFYGPPYYGSGTTYSLFGRTRSPTLEASPNAIDVLRLPTGTVSTSSTAQSAMRAGLGPIARAGSGSSAITRGGFGSSASAHASGARS